MNADEIIQALRDGTETCAECQFYGEPCGCNRPDGECDGWDIGQAAADLIESQQTRITELEAKLAASQRETRAAVEDLYTACRRSPCNSGICAKKNCTGNHIPCEFEWRGPQEAGEGETE